MELILIACLMAHLDAPTLMWFMWMFAVAARFVESWRKWS